MAKEVVNDMKCADDWELDDVERQLVTYMGLTCQGTLMRDTHSMQCALTELQDMGLPVEDIKQMTDCGALVARWADYDLKYWAKLRIVKKEGVRDLGLLYPPRVEMPRGPYDA